METTFFVLLMICTTKIINFYFLFNSFSQNFTSPYTIIVILTFFIAHMKSEFMVGLIILSPVVVHVLS